MYLSLSLSLCLSLSLSLSFLVRSCLLITLIKCLRGHKSQGSLCSVVKTLIVSGDQPREQGGKGQGHLLSCSGQLKIMNFYRDDFISSKLIVSPITLMFSMLEPSVAQTNGFWR